METPGPRIYQESGPETVGEILSRLFTARGWGRRQGRLHLEKAWAAAVGIEQAAHTRLAGMRRGILEVEVNNGVLLQELAQFHKRRLLQALRSQLPGAVVTDLRFRAGTWAS
jgi:predicted nucleic acid-binding Zn ribbon protein